MRISYMRRILTSEGEVTMVGQRLEFEDPPGNPRHCKAVSGVSEPAVLQGSEQHMPA